MLRLDQKVVGIDNFSTGKIKNLESVKKRGWNKKVEKFKFINDLSNLKNCLKVIKNIDIVIHQAARGSIPKSTKDPISTNKDNITSFLNILCVAKDENVKSFVYASSSSVWEIARNYEK